MNFGDDHGLGNLLAAFSTKAGYPTTTFFGKVSTASNLNNLQILTKPWKRIEV